MKNFFIPKIYGVVKDFHARMIPENKASDCRNVIFKQGLVRRRYGFAQLGAYVLNGAVTGITFYDQVRLGDKFCLVFTARDAYLYDTETGSFTLISQTYSTGTASANILAVAGSGTSWSGSLVDTYSIKFGTNNADTTAVNFTATASRYTSFGSAVYNLRSAMLSSSSSVVVYDDGTTSYARIITYTGTTVTVGSAYSIATGTKPYVARISDTSAIISYQNSNLYLIACTISGTTITFGSSVNAGVIAYSGLFQITMVSSTRGFTFCPITLLNYERVTGFAVSGTTITLDVSSGSIGVTPSASFDDIVCCPKSSTHAYAVYLSNTSGNVVIADVLSNGSASSVSYYNELSISVARLDGIAVVSSSRILLLGRTSSGCPCVYLINDSGSAFSSVTSLQLTTSTGRYCGDLKSIDSSHFMVIENYSTIKSHMVTVSGDTLSLVNTTDLKAMGSIYTSQSVSCAVFSTTKGIFFFGDGSASYYGKTSLLDIDTTNDTIALGGLGTVLTSVSSLAGLYVGLLLTGTFLQVGTRIKSIDWSGSTITLDRAASAEASGGSVSADISTWYSVDSIASVTSMTLNAIATFTGTLTSGSAVVTGIADTSVLHVGMGLSGTGIPSSASSPTYILSIDSATQITMSANASSSGTGVTITVGVAISSSHLVNYVLALSFSGDDEDFWSFAYPYSDAVHEKILVASNGVDALVKWAGTGSLAALGGSPPALARHIGYYGAAMYEHFLASWTKSGGYNLPQTIRVSDAGNAESWTAGAYYDLLQTNDEIVGMEILKTRLVIYKRRSISLGWADPSGGNTDPFNFDQDAITDIEVTCGRTVVSFGDFHLFLGADNVYKFNGIGLEEVGTEVINTMKNEWNGRYMSNAFAFAIPNENLYCIFVPTLETRDEFGVVIKDEARFPDKAYVYNYEERTWTIWTFPITGTVPLQFTCVGWVNKGYHPTVADIDALDRTYAQMNMRWADLIVYSKEESLLIGDSTGHIYEIREVYNSDNGVAIDAGFVTRDYPINDPKHIFYLNELVVGYNSVVNPGDLRVRASVDFGENWSNWVQFAQLNEQEYYEYICNFIMRGRQVRFEFANVSGSNFEFENFIVGYNDNDDQGVKRFNA